MLDPERSRRRKRIRYALLIALCLLAVLVRARTTWRIAAQLAGWEENYQVPVSLRLPAAEVTFVSEEAEAAGIRPGDRILAINGRSFDGYSDLIPSEPQVRITLERDGEIVEVAFRLQPRSLRNEPFGQRMLVIVLGGIMPWLCLLLGFWAAFVRPLDPQAWLLLLLMITFPHLAVSDIGSPNALVRILTLLYQEIMRAALPLAMVLFGIYFAERLPLDARHPWLKWTVLGPMMAAGAIHVPAQLLYMENVHAAPALIELDLPLQRYGFWLVFLSIGLFFLCTAVKVRAAGSKDARRRLQLLLWGALAAMLPSFILLIVTLAGGRSLEEILPGWAIIGTLMLLFIFPLTITYVVVVHRALDIRVVIRQSIQYTLARGGANILFALLAGAVLIGVLDLALELRRVQKIVLAASGIAAIVVLQRLRQRVAEWVDRRFFRQAYDAEHLLTDLSEEVRTMVDVGSLLRTVTERISQTLFVPRVAFLVADGDRFQTAYAVGFHPPPDVHFPESAATVQRLRDTREPVRVYFEDEDSWVYRTPGMSEEERERLRRLEPQLILPVAVREKLLGFISLGQKLSEEPYSGGDLRLLKVLAAQTGMALENSRLSAAVAAEAAQRERIARELEIARDVQERLFPQKPPALEGVEIAGICRPAEGVAGDYYDYFELSGGRLGFVVADVSGKGISAALLMASLQASIRSQTLREPADLGELIAQVNTLLYESSASSRYATLFYGRVDPKQARLDYVNAGHNPPLLLRREKESCSVRRLEIGGTVVGLLPRVPYQQGSEPLHSGDVLVAFTDGVSEALNPSGEEWGEQRLVEVLTRSACKPARELIAEIVQAVDRFRRGAPLPDDMTLVVLKVN